MKMELCPRFDYGSTVPWFQSDRTPEGKTSWIAKAGPNLAVFRADAVLKESATETISATFTPIAGQSRSFTLLTISHVGLQCRVAFSCFLSNEGDTSDTNFLRNAVQW